MALPAGVSTATISWGSLGDFFGNAASIVVTVKPLLGGDAKHVVWAATGQSLMQFNMESIAGAGEAATWQSPHVDQTGFIDGSGSAFTGWSYRADALVKIGKQSLSFTKFYQVMVGQNSVDLDLVPDGTVAAPSSSPLPSVLSVAGLTGAISAEDLLAELDIDATGLDEAALADYLATHEAYDLDRVDDTASRVAITPALQTKLTDLPTASALTASLAAKATDANVIHTTGAESAAGIKTFTSIPVLPATNPTTNDQATRKGYVDSAITTAITNLIGGAPGALDTLDELAAAINDDASYASAITTALGLKAADNAVVHLTGAESVAGIKTFTSIPVLPASDPTTANQSTRKSYVDATATTAASTRRLKTTPLAFVNRWTGSAWTYTTEAAAIAAGLETADSALHIGNTGGTAPTWIRDWDVWTQG